MQRRVCELLQLTNKPTTPPCQWGCLISVTHAGPCCCSPPCGASATRVCSPPGQGSATASPKISWTPMWGTGETIRTSPQELSKGWGWTWMENMEAAEESKSPHQAWLRSWISCQTLQARQISRWADVSICPSACWQWTTLLPSR